MSMLRRIRLEIAGIVQGVGFRPYLYRLAQRHALCGWVRNTPSGVELELEGPTEALSSFQDELARSTPPLAVVEQVLTVPLDGLVGYDRFTIRSSAEGDGGTLVSPDIAPCAACLRELADPADRRYRYPFINCTDCGPRFTIIRDLPYDRKTTSMAQFSMCPTCNAEYEDSHSRRYHAQPDCCPSCGPQVWLLDAEGRKIAGDVFAEAQKALARGDILAVKGLGGIHLACDARNAEAVRRLRRRKHREEKPLAVMCRDLNSARSLCRVTEAEASLLESVRRSIVLLEKKAPEDFANLSDNRRLGVMLPYTPLHVLLLDGTSGGPDALVMTSANLSDQPVLLENQEALDGLAGIADGFLLHDRPIQNRCDDSLVMAWQGREYFTAASRGYVPQPVTFARDATGVVAFGAEQKASFAVGRGQHVFLSQHIGDLKNLETLDHYREALDTFLRLFRITPSTLVCDLHPDYFSTREAQEHAQTLGASPPAGTAPLGAYGVLHGGQPARWAGIWHRVGRDGLWNGRFHLGGRVSGRRFPNFPAVRLDSPHLSSGRRCGDPGDRPDWVSLLWDAGLPLDRAPLESPKKQALRAMLDSHTACPKASSIGRLFDGVYSLLTGTQQVCYEGQGATRLQAMAREEIPGRSYPVAFYEKDGLRIFDTRPLLRAITGDLSDHVDPAAVARGFMDALCRMALEQCCLLNPGKLPVVLSGGVFLNEYLLSESTRLLTHAGFSVYTHHRVSTSDEGLCLGQLAIAAAKRS